MKIRVGFEPVYWQDVATAMVAYVKSGQYLPNKEIPSSERLPEITELLEDRTGKLFEACESGAVIDLLAWAKAKIERLQEECMKWSGIAGKNLARADKAEVEVKQILDALQLKLQPDGSPPSGGSMILAAWIINEAAARIRELEEKLGGKS